jgi:hypothetical protein
VRFDGQGFEAFCAAVNLISAMGHVEVVKELLKDNRVEFDQRLLTIVGETLKQKGLLDSEIQNLLSIKTWNI